MKKAIMVLSIAFTMLMAKTAKAQKTLKGKATFYAAKFQGRKTATGEVFKHNELTAASNNFKFNTILKVTNLKNLKSVIVRINDRMHPRMAAMGRVVDLTRAAAKQLDFKDGILNVSVEVVQPVL